MKMCWATDLLSLLGNSDIMSRDRSLVSKLMCLGMVIFVWLFHYNIPYDCFHPNNGLLSGLSLIDVHENIRKLFSAAVEKRLMSDRRIGCMLSGGLDSSLVAALLVKYAKQHKLPYRIQSFSIGMDGSPDIIAARKVKKSFVYFWYKVLKWNVIMNKMSGCQAYRYRASWGFHKWRRYRGSSW